LTKLYQRTLKYIFSISLLLIAILCSAQDKIEVEPDTISISLDPKKQKKIKEKIERDFKPSAINFGLDVLGLARTSLSTGFTRIEAQGDIDIDKYFFVLDLGHEATSISNSDFSYSNSGNYFRAGIQANIMPYNPNRDFLFVGLRYARSQFSDEIVFQNEFDKWGEKIFSYKNNGLTAHWWEVTLGMKVKVLERLYFGYTIRYKLAKNISGFGELIPRNLPGFGRADKSSSAGFSYYILYHLPFRDKPIPKKPKRTPREGDRNQQDQSSGFGDSFQRSF
jgi:hypothetical protein